VGGMENREEDKNLNPKASFPMSHFKKPQKSIK
jgi:hypothetical protein